MINKFLTPLECMIKHIEQDERLSMFCESLNRQLNDAPPSLLELPPSFTVGSFERVLSLKEVNILMAVYKAHGWILNIRNPKWDDGRVSYTVCVFTEKSIS